MKLKNEIKFILLLLLELTFHLANGQPWTIHQGCAEFNSKNMTCTKCIEGYNFDGLTSTCTYALEKCTNAFSGCSIDFCLKQQYTKCSQCVDSHVLSNLECRFDCKEQGYVKDQHNCNYCVNTNEKYLHHCTSCNFQEFICNSCEKGFFLFENECIESCPPGYFNNAYGYCIPCGPQCKECNSYDHCTKCKISTSVPPNCECQRGAFFNNQCITQCPASYSGQNCEDSCRFNFYKVLENGISTCKEVKSSQDLFCQQNLINLHEFVSSQIVEYIKPLKILVIQIALQDTPSVCYEYKLVDRQNNSYNLYFQPPNDSRSTQFFQREAYVYFTVPFYLFYNTTIFKNNVNHFTLKLKVFWLNTEYLTLKVPLLKENFYEFTGGVTNLSIERSIPQDQIIPSKLSFSCLSENQCDDTIVINPSTKLIEITQTVDEADFSKKLILPFSIKLEDKNQISFLKNFSFDNSIVGQIKYTFPTNNFSEGQLVISSILSNDNLQFQQETEQSAIRYLSKAIQYKLQVPEDKDDKDDKGDKDDTQDKDDIGDKDDEEDEDDTGDKDNIGDKDDTKDKDDKDHKDNKNQTKNPDQQDEENSSNSGLIITTLLIAGMILVGIAILCLLRKRIWRYPETPKGQVEMKIESTINSKENPYQAQVDA